MEVGRVRTRAVWRPDGNHGLCKLGERIKVTNPRPIFYLSALFADMSHIARSAPNGMFCLRHTNHQMTSVNKYG